MKPTRFVSLHNHTGASPFDGLGYPVDHFSWCIENGLTAHAITEHGNMNSYAYAQLSIDEWRKSDVIEKKAFKYIPGVEGYYHPDIQSWKLEKAAADEARALAKQNKKKKSEIVTEIRVVTDGNDETIEVNNSLTLENEEETKSGKTFNPINRRHHLVILPKNDEGLKSLFSIISKSYIEGFYRFPRMDRKMIKEHNKDHNLISSSACLHPDSEIITENGSFTIKEIVHKVNNGESVLVLSYDIENKCVVYKKVLWGDVTRKNAKIFNLKLKNGKTLKLTPDHKVFTERGWIEVQYLTNNDKILSY